MTISSTTRKAGPYFGDGVTTSFPFAFKVFKKQDVLVTFTSAVGVDSPLVLDSDYTVALNPDQDNNPGGTVQYPRTGSPLAVMAPGERLTLTGALPETQPTDIPNLSPFFPQVVEDGLDRATILIQQLQEQSDRAIKISVSDTPLTPLPTAAARANEVIGFDAVGNLTLYPIPASVGAGDMRVDPFVAGIDFTPGATTQLVLSRPPGNPANLEIFFDGFYQGPDQWNVSGAVVTFTSPIPVGTQNVFARIGTTLSTQVPPNRSVGDDQLLWDTVLARQVDSIADMRALDVSVYKTVNVRGYYGAGSLGDGFLYYDATDTTTPVDNGLVFGSLIGPGRWKRPATDRATFCDFGCVGDGVTDDSVRAQAAIDAMKGKRIDRNTGKTFLVAGLKLDGATYNNTIIGGRGLFKLKPDGGASNYGGGWVGLLIKDCDNVTSYPNWHGNRTAMTNREHIFCEGIAGATNWNHRQPMFSETRGDCIYIGQSNWQANSANPQRGVIEFVEHINLAFDGRNTISVISCTGLVIQGMKAQNSGGFVNGFFQPGGIDIEPDLGYEICSDIYIGPTEITTGGTSGLGIFGKSISGNDANVDWNCFDIRIAPARIMKFGTTGSTLSAGPFVRCADVFLEDFYISYEGGVRGAGPVFDFCQRIKGKIRAANVTNAVVLGPVGNVDGLELEVSAVNFSNAVVRATSATNGTVKAKANGAVAGAVAAVQFDNGGRSVTQQNMTYEVHAPYDGNMTRAMHNEPANPVVFGPGCIAQNGNWAGYPGGVGANTATIRTKNNSGWNNQNAMPTVGAWAQGTFVENDLVNQAVPGGGKMLTGWVRLNTGSNNALNTDWSQVVATTS